MNELNENDLGDLLVRLHDSIDQSTVMTPAAASQQIRRRAQHLARRRSAVSALAACGAVASLAAIAVIVAVSVKGDDRGVTRLVPLDPTTDSNPTSEPVSSAEPAPDPSTAPVVSNIPATSNAGEVPSVPLRPADNDWQVLPAAPLAERAGAAVVTVGDQLIVWGGGVPNHLDGSEPPYNDGAVLDISTGQWHSMADSPLTGGSSSGAPLDGQAIFVDATGSSAAYNPTTDTWVQIHGLAGGLNQIIVWDGTLVGTDGSGVAQLGTDGWLAMPIPDPAMHSGALVAVGDDLMLFAEGVAGGVVGYRYGDGVWTELSEAPPIDLTGEMFGVGAVDGRVVAVDWTMQAGVYDPATGQWARLPDVPGLPTKCQPQVAAIDATTVARMCGFVAVLPQTSSSWAISSPPSGPIDLGLHIDTDRVIAGRSMTIGDPAGQLLTPIVMGIITIDASALPNDFGSSGGGAPTVDRLSAHLSSSDCVLTVSADAIAQRTQVDAYDSAVTDLPPASITWGDTSGTAELRCGDGNAYRQALSTLLTAGERTVPVDATNEVMALGIAPAATAEELPEALWPALQQRHTDDEFAPQIAVTWEPGGSPIATIEVLGFADDSVFGLAYAIYGRSTPAGWVVDRATVASICRRGVAAGTNGQFCI